MTKVSGATIDQYGEFSGKLKTARALLEQRTLHPTTETHVYIFFISILSIIAIKKESTWIYNNR